MTGLPTAWVKKKLTETVEVFKNKQMILKSSVKHILKKPSFLLICLKKNETNLSILSRVLSNLIKVLILHPVHGICDNTNVKWSFWLCTYLKLMPFPSLDLITLRLMQICPFPHGFNGPPGDLCGLKLLTLSTSLKRL